MKKIVVGFGLALTLSTSAIALDNFKMDNCEQWVEQSLFNIEKIFGKGIGADDFDTQYKASMVTMSAYRACIAKKHNDKVETELKEIKQELYMIKSNLKVQNEQTAPKFNSNIGDYE